jgi:phosphatidylserine/phosphatidylglycerophosphate/cardiolipin synthase-like enzyme
LGNFKGGLPADSDNLDEKKESQESMQLFCSLKREAWGLPQEEWKTGTDHTRELQDAHLAMIRDAQRFIYMENQYFSGPRHGKTNSRNQVIQAIIDKIIEKHQKGEPFHFYCVLPIMPNGNPKDLKNQVIARKIWKAIKWFIDTINAATDNQCDKYVTFINLGKYAPDDHHSVNGFRQKYTHSKLLIADDDKMLIGSANCNERSMAGSEDSEVTLAMRGQQQEICQYRRELMAEHLGSATMRTLGDELEKPEAIQAVKQRLDTNLDGMFRQSDFDYSQCGLATPWGNIPTKSLSAGEQPPHVLSRTPLTARVVMGLSNVAQKAPR